MLAAACTGGSPAESPSIAGTYDCGLEGQSTLEVWELRDNGTLTVTSSADPGLDPAEGTWTVEGGQVIINYAGADNDPFDAEEDRLVFAGEAGPEGTWICTKAS